MLKSVLVLFATVVMVAAGDPVGPQPLLTMDQCGALISDDCRAEFKNANVNKNLDVFYYRCANEKGDKPLRTRCSLCCGKVALGHLMLLLIELTHLQIQVKRAAQPMTVLHAWQTPAAFGRMMPACRHPNPGRIGTGSNWVI